MYTTKNYSTDGGDKWVVEGTLDIATGGVISENGVAKTLLTPAETQADSVASTIAATVVDFNALLAKLKAAGIML